MKTSFHPSVFPITDTLNSVYKLGHQVETLFFSSLRPMACSILVPWSGFEPGPQQRKSWVLTTGLPGNSQDPVLGLCLWSLVLTHVGIFSRESDLALDPRWRIHMPAEHVIQIRRPWSSSACGSVRSVLPGNGHLEGRSDQREWKRRT